MRRPYYLATALYCALLFWMSHQSSLPGAQIAFAGADKIAHFIAYGILAMLVSVGLHRAPEPCSIQVRMFVPILFASLYGVSDEIHQLFTPGRTFSLLDMVADTLGATAAQGLCLYWFRREIGEVPVEEEGTI